MVILTDIILPVTLMLTGIFLTVKLKFIQVRCLFQGLKNMFSKKQGTKPGISPFRALMTSLAAQLGTGNIVGAGTAIILGGPGAVFWMWVSAFFGMATAYTEAYLAVKTRKQSADGSFYGGAQYYITRAFNGKAARVLSSLFSLFATAALGLTGVAVQANSISVSLNEAMSVPLWLTGIFLVTGAGIFMAKGSDAISAFAAKSVPPLAVLYIAGCIAVILFNIKNLPEAVGLIFRCAFSGEAICAGAMGEGVRKAVTQGIKKGLFTNEAGMGSTVSAHAMSNTESAHLQGTLGIAGVFIDTFLMLSLTALAIICTLYTNGSVPDISLSGSQAVSSSLSCVFTEKGAEIFVALSILFFAFASILGWSISGKVSAIYLFGEKSEVLYIISSLIFVFIGSVISAGTVWALTDLFNTLMVLTNVPSLIKLSPTKDTENRRTVKINKI